MIMMSAQVAYRLETVKTPGDCKIWLLVKQYYPVCSALIQSSMNDTLSNTTTIVISVSLC